MATELQQLQHRLADWQNVLSDREVDESRRAKQVKKARRRAVSHRGKPDAQEMAARYEDAQRRLAATRTAIGTANRALAKLKAQIKRVRSGGSRGKALTWARAHLGHVEKPAGSNREPGRDGITAWQQALGSYLVGLAWCGTFVGNALRHAGVHVSAQVASVSWIEDVARAHKDVFTGWSTSAASAKPGDLVVLFGRGVHVGMVESVHNGYLVTLEGNTSFGNSGSQSNGGCSTRRTRAFNLVHGIAHVRYP